MSQRDRIHHPRRSLPGLILGATLALIPSASTASDLPTLNELKASGARQSRYPQSTGSRGPPGNSAAFAGPASPEPPADSDETLRLVSRSGQDEGRPPNRRARPRPAERWRRRLVARGTRRSWETAKCLPRRSPRCRPKSEPEQSSCCLTRLDWPRWRGGPPGGSHRFDA